ncbi:arsenic resistance protein [Candidatus Aquiluna sp. UB-MaderosW2red]|uniref:arsenic resistance protein n=1 Tax=Candidatus Aquiluna sp. UB-MaderosW2red TaxID=1855377 RepID=UPI000875F0A6|nr:bile acid:sodium symporter [Candidatus Aquiluna sp. UB-MaderosW2red]SCX08577.1 Arsenite efflux pump ArsB, ACR3 family [Candidatus Aquiluna sp. UB-MaderosW2red]
MNWWTRHQVLLFIAAIAAGAIGGLLLPELSRPLGLAINPVLGLLMYAIFLGVPFMAAGRALADWRFMAALLVLNFVLVPIVVFGLSRLVQGETALLVGLLLVLLTPCVDYVIVFSGLAGGARDRLLAATPLLMLLQALLMPIYIWLMAGPNVVDAFEVRPFVEAFLMLIALPLSLAALTQLVATKSRAMRAIENVTAAAMVPLVMLTLAVVVGSQIFAVSGSIGSLIMVLPIFLLFVLILAPLGALAGRMAKLDASGRRTLVFSGVTRNSLVVLPLAMSLPPSFALTPLVVVTQTLFELVVMVVMVAVVPRVIRDRSGPEKAG